jgi:multiple sugar transport system substrate-binding protein
MEEIELTVMTTTGESADRLPRLRQLLDQFEARHHIPVRLNPIASESAWGKIVGYALYRQGPDISQVSSTWISNLASMEALRPFTEAELADLGGPKTFLPSLWQSGTSPSQEWVWAIPWQASPCLLYYRREALEQAGLDETKAFDTQAHLEQTLQRLQAAGISEPWAVPTRRTLKTLHYLASWVWSARGDFVSAEENKVLFNQSEALTGICNYFGLHRYLAPAKQTLEERLDLFLKGQTAVTLGGSRLWDEVLRRFATRADAVAHIGVASPLAIPFVNAEHFVVWKHSPPLRARAAVQLIRFLTGREAQNASSFHSGWLPTRLDLLAHAPFIEDAVYPVMGQALKAGRSYPPFPQWSLVEDKLVGELAQLWADILTARQPEIDGLIQRRLSSLAQRLNLSLARTRETYQNNDRFTTSDLRKVY